MKRAPIAHVVFPRPDLDQPLPQVPWDAASAQSRERRFDVELLVPVPRAGIRAFSSVRRRLKGADGWPEGLDARLESVKPRPTLIPYVPLLRRSVDSAAAAAAAHLVRRPKAGRPLLLQGMGLDGAAFVAAAAAKVIGARSLVIAEAGDAALLSPEHSKSPAGRRARKAIEWATEVVTTEESTREVLAHLGRSAECVSFGADPQRCQMAEMPSGPARLTALGPVGRTHGTDILLAAFSQIQDKDAELLLLGPVEEGFPLDALLDRFCIRHKVDTSGTIRSPLEALRKSTCLVAPVRDDPSRLRLIEALLVGRPVIATNVGDAPQIVDRSVGRIVPVEHAEALTQAIDEVLGRRWSATELREHALPLSLQTELPRFNAITERLLA